MQPSITTCLWLASQMEKLLAYKARALPVFGLGCQQPTGNKCSLTGLRNFLFLKRSLPTTETISNLTLLNFFSSRLSAPRTQKSAAGYTGKMINASAHSMVDTSMKRSSTSRPHTTQKDEDATQKGRSSQVRGTRRTLRRLAGVTMPLRPSPAPRLRCRPGLVCLLN